MVYSVRPPLPTGLDIDRSTGIITGTPVIATCETVSSLPPLNRWTVTAKEASGRLVQQVHFQLFVLERPGPLQYAHAVAHYAADMPIDPNRPLQPAARFVRFAVDPPLPPGLAIDAAGVISGTPTAPQDLMSYTVTALSPVGRASARIRIEVQPAVPPFRYPDPVISAVVGRPMAPTRPVLAGPGGSASPGCFSVVPDLPAGLALDPETGAIGGTPTEPTCALVCCAIAGRAHTFLAGRLASTLQWKV